MPTVDSNRLNGLASITATHTTVLCFSHLRWNFVYQRPQHLLTRAAAFADVFFVEEPVKTDNQKPQMRIECQPGGVHVMTPLLPHWSREQDAVEIQRALIDEWLRKRQTDDLIAWYYTPMALPFTNHLRPEITVYDCMDQLSAFQGAPPGLIEQEKRLFDRADVVFIGGRSLYEAKCGDHANVHLFPSSVDYAHFSASRAPQIDPEDQRHIPHPRIGFFGVLDERLDRELLRKIAALEPAWHFVLVGPVVKISQDDLPRAANIHYLGSKAYSQLPGYVAHWDVAMLPFAQNASTRFISPTKTPEYLAAGKPVVSTPIRDVAEPYGRLRLAKIASSAEDFCEAIRNSLELPEAGWLPAADRFLRNTSWDKTFQAMWKEVLQCGSYSSKSCETEEVVNAIRDCA